MAERTTELENRQNNHGGKRPGAGRKQMNGGEETTRKMKRLFTEYITEEEVRLIFDSAIADALDGKTDMQKFILEQLFGKATQKIAGDDTMDQLKLIQIIKNGDSNNQPTT